MLRFSAVINLCQKLTLASVAAMGAIAAILIGAASLAQRQNRNHDSKRVSCHKHPRWRENR